jgi:hypothetical protein
MAKDWRLAVCTKWRPLVTVLLIIGLSFIAIAIGFLVEVVGPDIWDKARSLAIGMSEEELTKIMGTRFYTETVNTSQIADRSSWATQDYGRFRLAYERVIEYTFYEKRSFGSQAVGWVGGIYLDEARQKIVFLQPRMGWDDLILAGRYEALFLLTIFIALPWIALRLWCHRQERKCRAVEEDPKRSIDA